MVCFCYVLGMVSDIFTLVGTVVEIPGIYCRVWLLLGQHSVCCDSSEALQNGDPNMDQQNVLLLFYYGHCFWLFRHVLPIQSVQRKVKV